MADKCATGNCEYRNFACRICLDIKLQSVTSFAGIRRKGKPEKALDDLCRLLEQIAILILRLMH